MDFQGLILWRGRGSAGSRETCHAGTQAHCITFNQSATWHTHRMTFGAAPSSSGASAHAAAARRPPLSGQARARRGKQGSRRARTGDRLALADDQRVLQVQHRLLPVRRPTPARRPATGGRVSPTRARRPPPSSPAPQAHRLCRAAAACRGRTGPARRSAAPGARRPRARRARRGGRGRRAPPGSARVHFLCQMFARTVINPGRHISPH